VLYRYSLNGPRTSIGCGQLLALLGLVLLTPLIDILIDILGWTLVVGLLLAILGGVSWLLGRRRRDYWG
jgi:hypothetical protein